MKNTLLFLIPFLPFNVSALSPWPWGVYFEPSNYGARTRLYTADGPLAGPEILGQWLVGPTDSQLAVFGYPVPHEIGLAEGPYMPVENVDPYQLARVQLVAWDQRLWGSSYANVPPEQMGRTDIVGVRLTSPPSPLFSPDFQQPAIVPIPEPSSVWLGLLGMGMLAWWRWRVWTTP